jgi:molybdate transport system substrate-binding protein
VLVVAALAAAALHTLGSEKKLETCKERVKLRVLLCAAAYEVWERTIAMYEAKSCVDVEPVYGSSGQLLAQLSVSQDVDVYAPASWEYMEAALERGLVEPGSVEPLASYELAVLVRAGNPLNITRIEELARPGIKVAICEPEGAACGRYAVALLKDLGLYDEVSRNIVVYAENYAKLVALLRSGAVDAIIGWNVGHYWDPNSTLLIPIEEESPHKAAAIYIGVAASSQKKEEAAKFIEFLKSPEIVNIWRSYGYQVEVTSRETP